MGLLDLIKWNRWRIVSLDAGVVLELASQAPPEDGMTVEAAPGFAEGATVGSAAPVGQWVHGPGRRLTLRSVFWALHMLDDIRPKREALERLTALDRTLGRAPRVALTWGDLTLEGFVSRCSYTVAGFWPVSGWPRVITFDLEIVELAAPTDTDAGTGETQWVVLAGSETFEALASRYYGNPLRGEVLRRVNPDFADGETTGDRVKVLEPEHKAVRASIAPTSPPFQDRTRTGETWQPILEELAESRGRDVSGLPWANLPEVRDGEVM